MKLSMWLSGKAKGGDIASHGNDEQRCIAGKGAIPYSHYLRDGTLDCADNVGAKPPFQQTLQIAQRDGGNLAERLPGKESLMSGDQYIGKRHQPLERIIINNFGRMIAEEQFAL